MTKAIVFDVSGTLLDDIQAVWRADAAAYAKFGYDGLDTLEKFRAKFKFPMSQFHRDNGIPPEMDKKIEDYYRLVYPDFAHNVRIFDDVPGALARLNQRGIKLGVASNIPSLTLAEHLDRFGIAKYFAAVTGQDDCEEPKPSPQPIPVNAF